MDHPEGPLRERRSGNVAVLPREPAKFVRPVRPVAGPGAGQGDRWVRAGDGASASNGEGQCDARRGCGGHGHGDERRREQRGDDRGSDRGPDGRRPSPRWHAARRVRDALARRRRRALGARCAHQEARGPILRERPAPGGGDGPHRTTSDGARDPMSAPPAPVRGEGLIDAGGIDGGTDGFPVSRRRLGGRPPGDDPEEGPTSLLFDYGLLPRDPPQYPLPAPPVDGMFISHAHLDHTGMIPWVTRRQDVDVVLTPPTADVADLLLQDSLKIADAEGFDAPFDDGDLRTARRRFRTIDFGDNVDMGEVEVTAHPAGHIPGATMFEVNGAETSLFTGDLHTLTTDLVWGAKPVACD